MPLWLAYFPSEIITGRRRHPLNLQGGVERRDGCGFSGAFAAAARRWAIAWQAAGRESIAGEPPFSSLRFLLPLPFFLLVHFLIFVFIIFFGLRDVMLQLVKENPSSLGNIPSHTQPHQQQHQRIDGTLKQPNQPAIGRADHQSHTGCREGEAVSFPSHRMPWAPAIVNQSCGLQLSSTGRHVGATLAKRHPDSDEFSGQQLTTTIYRANQGASGITADSRGTTSAVRLPSRRDG